MKTFLIYFYILLWSLLVCGCYHNEIPPTEVVIYPDSLFTYKLQIKKHIIGNINLMAPSWEHYDYFTSDWIYVNKITGRLETSEFKITPFYGSPEHPLAEYGYTRGFVEFLEDSASIKIQFAYPSKPNNELKWFDYIMNGIYKIRQDSIVPPNERNERYK